MEKKSLDEVIEKLKGVSFREEFDLVVGIGRGGVIPAALVSQKLGLPLEIIRIRYRDDQHTPLYDTPKILDDGITFFFEKKRILLVDDVSRTGKTFARAKQSLAGARDIKTFAVIATDGQADYSCYQGECFRFPWLL
jgi:hypoxanthine phosphoribosyltransferase